MTTKRDVINAHLEHPDWTAPEIAAALGCGAGYVRGTALRNGLRLPVTKRRIDWNAIGVAAEARWNGGDSLTQIARGLGVSRSAIAGYLKRRGLVPRPENREAAA